MKRTIQSIVMVIAAMVTIGSMVFTSCNKAEEIVSTDNTNPPAMKTLTLTSAQRNNIARSLAIYMSANPVSFVQLNQAIHF